MTYTLLEDIPDKRSKDNKDFYLSFQYEEKGNTIKFITRDMKTLVIAIEGDRKNEILADIIKCALAPSMLERAGYKFGIAYRIHDNKAAEDLLNKLATINKFPKGLVMSFQGFHAKYHELLKARDAKIGAAAMPVADGGKETAGMAQLLINSAGNPMMTNSDKQPGAEQDVKENINKP